MIAESGVKKARVLLVDDHPAIGDALEVFLSRTEDLELGGRAATVIEAMRAIEQNRPDAVVVDLTLGDQNGLELLERIRDRHPGLATIAWTAHHDLHYAERALRAGARGFVTKTEPTSTIVRALRTALTGQIFLNDTLSQVLLQRVAARGSQQAMIEPEDLSNRELEVFRLIGQGKKTREIAKLMHVSMNTVQTYRERIRRKFSLEDTTDVVHFATTWLAHHSPNTA